MNTMAVCEVEGRIVGKQLASNMECDDPIEKCSNSILAMRGKYIFLNAGAV